MKTVQLTSHRVLIERTQHPIKDVEAKQDTPIYFLELSTLAKTKIVIMNLTFNEVVENSDDDGIMVKISDGVPQRETDKDLNEAG